MWMLLHGFTGSPRSWDAVVAHAALDEEPIRPSLTGHGPDWKDEATDSFSGEVSRLSTIASSQSTPRLVAGYSLGARLALGMLATDADLFDGAVLIGVHPGLQNDEARRKRVELDRDRARQLRTKGLAAFIAAWEQQPLFETQRELPQETIDRQRDVRLGHDAEGLARSLEAQGLGSMPSYVDALSSIRFPVILMVGARDSRFCDLGSRLSAENPHVELVTVEGAGHNLLLEASEAVAMAMSRVERVALAEGEA